MYNKGCFMEEKYDVNDFYVIEYVCSKCDNICSKHDQSCRVCGNAKISKKTVCRSCLDYRYCPDPDCSYSSHTETLVCPGCGKPTKGCYTMIAEDHWGLPIPAQEDCVGDLRDDDEGVRMAKHRFV